MDFILHKTAPVESMTLTFKDGRTLYMTDICEPSLSRFFLIFDWTADELRFVHLTSSEPFSAFFSPSSIYDGYIPLRITEEVLRMTEDEVREHADKVYDMVHTELNQMAHVALWNDKDVVWTIHQISLDTAYGYSIIQHKDVMLNGHVNAPLNIGGYYAYPVSDELSELLDIRPAEINMSPEFRLLTAIYSE